ncbi:MAG: helicase C-terminal domain-containing protein [Eggerthellaceae bacterium]|jgi:ATP-dependent DNA helicase DinG
MTSQNTPENKTNAQLNAYILDGTPEEIRERYASLVEAASRADYEIYDNNLVVVDTEATGFSFHHDELIQIAAARIENGEIVDWFITFVNPGQAIPENIVHLTHIHDEDVAEAPTPSEALEQLVDFVGDARLVAHNVGFDKTFLTKHPQGYPLLEHTWIDSLDLARIALPRLKSHRLIDLVHAFGAPVSTHRADADVAATAYVLRVLLAAIDAMPNALVSAIAQFGTDESWSSREVFSYFAQKKGATDVKLSLSALRKSRLEKTENARAKIDAELISEDTERTLVFPDEETLDQAFSEDGLMGKIYENYEPRSEQVRMAQAVRDAFKTSSNLVIEAGTGVGKSLAYLVPAVLTARANNITVGVATKTNALLDQLNYKELPALARALKEEGLTPDLSFASLKGYAHYPCLHKVDMLLRRGPSMVEVNGQEVSQAPAFAALLSFIEQTGFDDIDQLKLDFRAMPRYLTTTTSHECLRFSCPYYRGGCFVHGARRAAEKADILLTNHSLFFRDVAVSGGLLPPVRYWIVDEAHNAEGEARKALSKTFETMTALRLARRFNNRSDGKNIFEEAEQKVSSTSDSNEKLYLALSSKAQRLAQTYEDQVHKVCQAIKSLTALDANKRNKGYERLELWINDDVRASEPFKVLEGEGRDLIEVSDKLVETSQELVGYLEDVEGTAQIQREIAACALDLKDLKDALSIILKTENDNYAFSATLYRKQDNHNDRLEALLMNVGERMNDLFYGRIHSVVFTSATLTINSSFDVFTAALGLTECSETQTKTLALDSSFDFDNRMKVYVVDDLPEPNEPGYLEVLEEALVQMHEAMRGSALTLFTNRKDMEACFEAVSPRLRDMGLRVVCQKWGVSVKALRDDFVEDEHLSLFALKSFWEGFDAPGATLKGVLIPKIPFAKPTDPLSCERALRDERAWAHYVLPQAVLEVKQAAGRLIRKKDDEGVLILLDRRFVSKHYGRTFLNSLQSKNIEVCSGAAVVEALEEHFSR